VKEARVSHVGHVSQITPNAPGGRATRPGPGRWGRVAAEVRACSTPRSTRR
jgi:hypothetical protein